jgi:hypothetical protein
MHDDIDAISDVPFNRTHGTVFRFRFEEHSLNRAKPCRALAAFTVDRLVVSGMVAGRSSGVVTPGSPITFEFTSGA